MATGFLSTDKSSFDLKRAILFKSAKMDYNAALVKAYTFPQFQRLDNAHWPEFYIYMTTTNGNAAPSETG